ncbi:hypothetical protein B566_EDAN013127 [Ephemera danica]|nr:hypothetical protein B566_EDAN013127 [Ephemera danica]
MMSPKNINELDLFHGKPTRAMPEESYDDVISLILSIWTGARDKKKIKKLQIVQNKTLSAIAKSRKGTRIKKLHEDLKMPMINEVITKLNEKFYATSKDHDNPLISGFANSEPTWWERTARPATSSTAARHTTQKTFVFKDLATATHVFLRSDFARSSLEPPYTGPYEVVSRNDKTFKIIVNNKAVVVTIDQSTRKQAGSQGPQWSTLTMEPYILFDSFQQEKLFDDKLSDVLDEVGELETKRAKTTKATTKLIVKCIFIKNSDSEWKTINPITIAAPWSSLEWDDGPVSREEYSSFLLQNKLNSEFTSGVCFNWAFREIVSGHCHLKKIIEKILVFEGRSFDFKQLEDKLDSFKSQTEDLVRRCTEVLEKSIDSAKKIGVLNAELEVLETDLTNAQLTELSHLLGLELMFYSSAIEKQVQIETSIGHEEILYMDQHKQINTLEERKAEMIAQQNRKTDLRVSRLTYGVSRLDSDLDGESNE